MLPNSASTTEKTAGHGIRLHSDLKETGPPAFISHYSIRDLLTTLFREKKLISLIFILSVSAGATVALRLEPLYTAQARILVLPGRAYTLNSDVGEIASNFSLGDERIVRSETEILKNPTLIEETIQTIGMEKLYPKLGAESFLAKISRRAKDLLRSWFFSENEVKVADPATADPMSNLKRKLLNQAITRFNKNLEIVPVKDASVISLTFSHSQSALAVNALNGLILGYLDLRAQVLAQPRAKIFIEQRDGFAQRLSNLEQEIEAFKLQNNISTFADQRSLLLRQQAEVNNNKMDTDARLNEIEGRITTLRKQINTIPKEISLYSESSVQDSADTTRSILVTLEARRNELLTKFTPNSQFVTDINEQIAKLKQTLAITKPKKSDNQRIGRNPIYDDINLDWVRQESAAAALRAKRISLEEQFSQISAQLVKFDRLEKKFNALNLERELLDKNLRIYAQKAEEALVQEELDRQKMANIRIIEQAQTHEPRSLKGPILIFSVVGAIILALLMTFFKDFFRQVFVSPEDTERLLGLPVLMTIPVKPPLADSEHAQIYSLEK